MNWVVAALTVVVGILTLLVLGLLRSHAELLQRTADDREAPGPEPDGEPSSMSFPDGVVSAPDSVPSTAIASIEGIDCELEPYRLEVGALATPYLLVAFLSTTCFSCLDIWRDIIEEGDDARSVRAGDDAASVIIALKGREHENLGKATALAVETRIPVVMSSAAWTEFDVAGSPYFALVSTREGRIVGAGSASSWHQIKSLAEDGMLELSVAGKQPAGGRRRGGYRSIIEREDEDLMRAGVYPGHPSLTAPLVETGPSAPTAHQRTGDGGS